MTVGNHRRGFLLGDRSTYRMRVGCRQPRKGPRKDVPRKVSEWHDHGYGGRGKEVHVRSIPPCDRQVTYLPHKDPNTGTY